MPRALSELLGSFAHVHGGVGWGCLLRHSLSQLPKACTLVRVCLLEQQGAFLAFLAHFSAIKRTFLLPFRGQAASGCNVDAVQATNVPRVVADEGFAALLRDMITGSHRTARDAQAAFDAARQDRDASSPTPTSRQMNTVSTDSEGACRWVLGVG